MKLSQIDIREECQSRAAGGLDEDYVAELVAALKRGETLPPILVVLTDDNESTAPWICVDGFHRVAAHALAGRRAIEIVQVDEGPLDVARWHAAGANGTHGRRRTNADKRAAITQALDARPDASDREIARHVRVDHKTVAAVRCPPKVGNSPTLTGSQSAASGTEPPASDPPGAPEDDGETGDEDTTDQPPVDPLDAVLAAAHASAESILEPLKAAVKAAHAVKRAGGPLAASAAMLPKKIATARKAFEQHLPVRCPKCGQDTREDCAHCRGKGWIKTMSDQ